MPPAQQARRIRAENYADLKRTRPVAASMRAAAREAVIAVSSLLSRVPTHGEWIIMPFYHHVLNDERLAFDRQLRYMRHWGEFCSLDQAIDAVQSPQGIGGRYFCITFDDGFENCFTNALPILLDHQCPAAFFIPTYYIGLDLDKDWDALQPFLATSPSCTVPFQFLTWDQCRRMQAAGMTFGAHTQTHLRPAQRTPAVFADELRRSKARIEQELGGPCQHFACPFGQPGIDYDPLVHPELARLAGYRSFLTTRRGANIANSDPFAIRREHLLAADRLYLLRYFFARAGKTL